MICKSKINLRFKWRPNSTESEIVRNEPYNPTDDYFKMLYSSSSDKYDSEACFESVTQNRQNAILLCQFS